MKKGVIIGVIILLIIVGWFFVRKNDKKERFDISISEVTAVDGGYEYSLSFKNNGASVTHLYSGTLNFVDKSSGELKYSFVFEEIYFQWVISEGQYGMYSLYVAEKAYFGVDNIEIVLEDYSCGCSWIPGAPPCD